MPKVPSIPDVVEEICQSVRVTPRQQQRLRSSTFWDMFGFTKRTRGRVESVKDAMQTCGLKVNLDTFGSEDRDEWIVISYVEPELQREAAEPAELVLGNR